MDGGDTNEKEILRTKEAAELLKVTTQTIKNYIYSGKLKAVKTPGGHHRIRRSDLRELGFLKEPMADEDTMTHGQLLHAYRQLLQSFLGTVRVVLRALDSRDTIASGHSNRVAHYATAVAETMGLSVHDKRDLELGALFHDVGKVGISESILGKPGRLTDQEFLLVRRHPEIGESILKEVEFLKPSLSIVRHHHERWDGQGYPDGLSGEAIPLGPRIVAVAETYDFLRSALSFREGLSFEESIEELKGAAGSQLDPDIVDTFVDWAKRTELR